MSYSASISWDLEFVSSNFNVLRISVLIFLPSHLLRGYANFDPCFVMEGNPRWLRHLCRFDVHYFDFCLELIGGRFHFWYDQNH